MSMREYTAALILPFCLALGACPSNSADKNTDPAALTANAYLGVCDGSAAIAMPDGKGFMVAADDSNVLLAPDIPYDTLVQVMDTVRVWVVEDGTYRKAELFPDISVGEAPLTGDALAQSLAAPATGARK